MKNVLSPDYYGNLTFQVCFTDIIVDKTSDSGEPITN